MGIGKKDRFPGWERVPDDQLGTKEGLVHEFAIPFHEASCLGFFEKLKPFQISLPEDPLGLSEFASDARKTHQQWLAGLAKAGEESIRDSIRGLQPGWYRRKKEESTAQIRPPELPQSINLEQEQPGSIVNLSVPLVSPRPEAPSPRRKRGRPKKDSDPIAKLMLFIAYEMLSENNDSFCFWSKREWARNLGCNHRSISDKMIEAIDKLKERVDKGKFVQPGIG